jgi:hypothetical protein
LLAPSSSHLVEPLLCCRAPNTEQPSTFAAFSALALVIPIDTPRRRKTSLPPCLIRDSRRSSSMRGTCCSHCHSSRPTPDEERETDIATRQEPDPATNSRAVPIYATTVRRPCSMVPVEKQLTGRNRATSSMTRPMAPASSGSRSLATSTPGS